MSPVNHVCKITVPAGTATEAAIVVVAASAAVAVVVVSNGNNTSKNSYSNSYSLVALQ